MSQITLQQFVNTIINTYPNPQNISRLFKKMENDNYYLFGKIFRKLIEKAEENNIYTLRNYNYGFFDENTVNDNEIKLILFFRYKTPKQLSKYIKLLPEYNFFFEEYIKQFNNSYFKHMCNTNNKYILPPTLRKMTSYNLLDIRTTIINNIGNRYVFTNEYYYWDISDFIMETLDKKTIKDCISIKSKLKKDHIKNIKLEPKLQNEYDNFNNNYTEPDRENIFMELTRNLENLKGKITTYTYKIRAIDEYMEILSGNLP